MSAHRFEGGCLCGAIRYVSTAAPTRCVVCHCGDCRKHSGAPCLSFVHFPVEAFAWTTGKPRRFRSSEFAERGFCPTCGSTLTMHEEVLEDRVQVSLGSLDHPERVSPDDHVWTRSRIPWFEIDDALPRYSTSSPAAPTQADQE
jgi:hypothetical protein